MKVRLTKKLAEEIDGVDLSHRRAGEIFDLPPQEARLLVAEDWAAPERRWLSAGRRTGDAGEKLRSSVEHAAARDCRPSRDRRFHCRRGAPEAQGPPREGHP